MSDLERRLEELGMQLPPALTAVANYRPAKRSGQYVFVSGHGPFGPDGPRYTGVVGLDLSVADGRAAAELTMLSIFATLRAELGDLDHIDEFERLLVMVQSSPDFHEHHLVADGASDLLTAVLGKARGAHARAAVGMASLPFNIAVEIEAIVRVNGAST